MLVSVVNPRIAIILLGAFAPFSFAADVATVDNLKQSLTRRLIKLKPDDATERNVLFQEVRAGRASGDSYPFQVTVLVRDYSPGYPRNRYYGQTCVGKIQQATFYVSRDPFGDWSAEGAMTPPTRDCKPNPSDGVSSIPLASLSGTPAPPPGQGGATAPPQRAPQASGSSSLPTGEWACYGSGGTLLIGLGFRIQAGGTYTDLDNKSKGTYTYTGGSITFRGGHLDGQVARNVSPNHFNIGTTTCEPFR